uniref:tsukushin n=1 Tax=Osmia lignaria TaxID=473952 RepID=UPI00147866E3|nr:tsukushin [Osmia lignaria]XP_034175495.1 tsukushin [Osmia lignaria]
MKYSMGIWLPLTKPHMSIFLVNGLSMLLLVVAIVPEATVLGSNPTLIMEQDLPLKTCRYSKAYSMFQVRCSNLGLDDIPSTLKTDIQILDASVNRIRKLTNDSLAAYKTLSYLYLGDNFIQDIHEGAFSNLQYLEVLDLSKNGCRDLPRNLFQLPYLRKVYLCDNKLDDVVFRRMDVRSPLTFLQLSKNNICRIPQLGPVPSLAHLNVSGNCIAAVSPEDLAPFCSLKLLDLSGNPIKFDANECECLAFNAWLNARGIHSSPVFNCTDEEERGCSPRQEFSNKTSELYERCTEILRFQIETEKARTTWIVVACCIAAFLFCLFISLLCVHKKNKRKKRRLKEEQRLNANNANTELLNSNLNQPENT